MNLRVAFAGFRHGHILAMYHLLRKRDDVAVVAACEEDAATRASLDVEITHHSLSEMLDGVECDVVACGDYYAARGAALIRALESGRHAIADKPICTSLDELDRIARLAHANRLRVGCMLDLVDLAPYRTLRRIVREGAIGEVHTVWFSGQHPLNYGSRPAWYFEPGKQGGTLNDIAIHAVDALPWITGQAIVEVTAARAWNARLAECPHFQDAAMLLLRLANGGGAMGDVSYLAPENFGYRLPSYWRFTLSGSQGQAETACGATAVTVHRKGTDEVEQVPLDAGRPGGYFEDFLLDLAGRPNPDGLDTARVLRSARAALVAQAAADAGEFPRPV